MARSGLPLESLLPSSEGWRRDENCADVNRLFEGGVHVPPVLARRDPKELLPVAVTVKKDACSIERW